MTVREYLPGEGGFLHWTLFVAVALGMGVLLQLIMVGAQGAFAQVLPVPGGRSIRGGSAVFGGAMLLVALGLGTAGGTLALEAVGRAALVLLVLAGVALVAMLVSYIWAWPVAQRDFAED